MDDEKFAAIMRSLSNQGRDDNGMWMNHIRLGYNYRLDEMSAALGLSQLQRLEEILARRPQVAGWYTERIRRLELVQPHYVAPATTRMIGSYTSCGSTRRHRSDCADRPTRGGRDSNAAVLCTNPFAASVPRAIWFPARGFPGDRASWRRRRWPCRSLLR